MRKFFSRCTPPGVDAAKECKHLILWLSLAAGFSLGTVIRYLNARADLFETVAGVRMLREGAVIADFHLLTGISFQGFVLLIPAIACGAACMLYFALASFPADAAAELAHSNENVFKMTRNLSRVAVMSAGEVDVYTLMRFKTVVADKAAFDALMARAARKETK